jgi:ATP-dependent exoDNAse (exonuclease V) beta subunit
MERDERGWMIDLDGLRWEEPAGLGIRDMELAYQKAERQRVAYVAAARARELLIIPKAGEIKPGYFVCSDLIADAPADLVHEVPPYIDGREPDWARQKGAKAKPAPADGARVERDVSEWWTPRSAEAARPRFRPTSVSGESHAAPLDETEEAILAEPIKRREGRFGALFGTTVHHAIGLILRENALPAEEAVRRAADRFGLEEHLLECIADVTRAIGALRAEGLLRPLGSDLQVEYPVAAAWEGGQLLGGYIDLVSVSDDRLDVIDFKTDVPPEGPVERVYPTYTAQVQAYGRLAEMSTALGSRKLRCGLMFTADGEIRWL